MPRSSRSRSKKLPKKSKLKLVIYWPVLILSLFLIVFGFVKLYFFQDLSFWTKPVEIENVAGVIPDRILIPSINVDLPVVPVTISGNRWPTVSNGVAYLSSSPLPGNNGNSVIYGHNWPNLLGKLKQISASDEIVLISTDSSRIVFSVESIKIVDPNDLSVLAPTDKPTLTLYTCTGIFDSKRLVVLAKPK